MEIRFCDRCTESIPDTDFDSGRAVTVDGRHYHVTCALTRSLALNGRRSWLTFLLALYAAGVVTFLLVGALGRGEKAPEVPPLVEARITEAVGSLEGAVTRDRLTALGALRQEAAAERAAAVKKLATAVDAQLAVVGSRLDETDRLANDRVSALAQKVQQAEDEIAHLSALIRQVQEDAKAEATRRVAAPAPPQPTPAEPTPPEPAPAPAEPMPSDPEHDADVARWMDRLRDSNENIRFSATLELGRLKDLRAAPALIEVLREDRDYYVRLGAATALGDMKACAAVPALIDALDDKDTLVRTAANDALQAITGQAYEFVTEMSGRERRKVMKQWRDWWKANEAAVRDRLGQPAT
jgi:hypothetical protein